MILTHSSKIKSLYDEAEKALKLYERVTLSNLAPALNELRYAGHHLLEALNATDDEAREMHENRAIGHCERAKFDAKEATVISLLECIADLRSLGISADEMRAFILEWDSLIDEASAARALLERQGNIKDSDTEEQLDMAIQKLLDFRDRILVVEADVISLRNKREEEARKIEEFNLLEKARAENEANWVRERKEDRRYVFSVILAVISIALAVLGIVLTLKAD